MDDNRPKRDRPVEWDTYRPSKRVQTEKKESKPKIEIDQPLPFKKRLTALQRESDPVKLASRKKQIDFGKATKGYQRYLQEVPIHKRKKELKHPSTPDRFQMCSKRSFDGQVHTFDSPDFFSHILQVRSWRRALHEWDPKEEGLEITMDELGDLASLLQEENGQSSHVLEEIHFSDSSSQESSTTRVDMDEAESYYYDL